MTDLLTQLGWKLAPAEPQKRTTDAPPPPPKKPSSGRDDNHQWEIILLNRIEDLRWEIEEKGWRSGVNIQKDIVNFLDIPEQYIRSYLTPSRFPKFYRHVVGGS